MLAFLTTLGIFITLISAVDGSIAFGLAGQTLTLLINIVGPTAEAGTEHHRIWRKRGNKMGLKSTAANLTCGVIFTWLDLEELR